jgi:cytochrome c oxidase subunit 2
VTSRTRKGHRARFAALLAVLALVATACGDEDLPQDALDPQGPVARQLDRLFDPVFLIAVVIFFLVEGLVLFAVIRFRARSDDERPRQVHGNAWLELTWTLIPAVLLAVVGVATLSTLFDINEVDASDDALEVEVVGHQWWWEYRYPDLGIVTANELHIPAGRPVTLSLTSEDVMHNFWPPKLAGKVYAIPGRVNHMEVEADRPGNYNGQCAEYCGESHANMRLRVVAHDAAGFQRWVQGQQQPAAMPAGGPAAEGAELFRTLCASCHTVRGLQGAEGVVGPDLTHLQSRKVFAGAIFDLDERNLRRWLRDPPAEKPGSKMPNLQLAEEDIEKLIRYLETLK